MRASLPVRPPYRLDLTVDALRRVPGNVVDIVTPDGRYVRALAHAGSINVIEVEQGSRDALDVTITGPAARAQLPTIATMLGTQVDLRDWYRRTKNFPWLAHLAKRLRGVKPPRYPELWEALCHGIVFQQLSIVAAATVMQRFVQRFSKPIAHGSVRLYPFPRPEVVATARANTLRSIGLSRMKAAYLKDAAKGILSGSIDARTIESLPSDGAISALQTIRGIGRWSAANVLLRGFGRLDVFPPTDSGASRSMKILSSDPRIDAQTVLEKLDGLRGMLYFHLLLGTLYGITLEEGRHER
jgi:DNA-3-methyladenine glycosylase II